MGKRLTIGFLDEDAYDEYHNLIAAGVKMSAQQHDINIIRFGHFLVNITKPAPYHEEILHEFIKQFKLDGLLFLGWGRAFVKDSFKKKFRDIPMASIGVGLAGITSIIFHGDTYVEEILHHLIQVHGKSKIAYIAPANPDLRNQVYIRVMKQHSLYDPQLYIGEEELEDLSFNARGVRAVEILLDERRIKIDAIVSLYNEETYAVIKSLNARGLRVPEDIAVTSYEDGEISRFSSPSFTTVYFPWKEMGYHGCEALYSLMTKGSAPLRTEISGKVIYRNSCGCSPHSAELEGLDISRQAETGFEELNEQELEEIAKRIAEVTFFTMEELRLLLYSFGQAITGGSDKLFVTEFKIILRRADIYERHHDIEQDVLLFRKVLMPYLLPYKAGRAELIVKAENLFYQMQSILQTKRTNAWFSEEIRYKSIKLILKEVGQIFITNFNVNSLMDSIETNLPRIGVNGCYIYLFNKSDNGVDLFDDYRLEFEYSDGKRVGNSKKHRKANGQNLQKTLFSEDRAYFMLAHLLNIGDDFMGFVLFDPSYTDLRIYRTLGLHISTALNNVIMFRKLDAGYRKLMEQAHKKGMADSTVVLHDIANIMNSVNITAQAMANLMKECPTEDLIMANSLLKSKADNLARFIHNDNKGKLLMRFYSDLGGKFLEYSERMQTHISRLMANIKLIEGIINSQQSYTGVRSNLESIDLATAVDDVIRMYNAIIDKADIKVVRKYETSMAALAQRAKLYHVLTNIIKNAIESMENTYDEKILTIVISEEAQNICIRICDTGSGLSAGELESIFAYGYTTKKDGHGFGLHSCANYMTEMKGRLRAENSESGKGAVFVLEFKAPADN